MDGVSRFDIIQGQIGKVMILFRKRLAQPNNLWLLCYVLSSWWKGMDHGACSKQIISVGHSRPPQIPTQFIGDIQWDSQM